MSADRLRRLEELYHAAMARPVETREAFLDHACRDNVALREEVLSLLAHAPSAADFLERPAVNAAAESGTMSLVAGTRFGPYEILEPIGAGGMGEVYRARDAKLHRDVALKVLPEGLAIDAERLARFKREAQVLGSLNHPNIAAIYGFEESDGVHALVLEFVEGPTLADRLRRGPVPLDEALPIARQIAEGLEAAHEVGIVHRDLKPANIKLRPDGTVKVLDFGLAKPLELRGDASGHASAPITSPAMTELGVILGTAAYMSPEQAKGQPADRRSDVWSLGAVLYEVLSGRRPFGGEDVTDTLAAVLRAEPAWTELPSDTPAAMRRLLQRCLQKDAKRRWQHIGDVRLELAELEQGRQDGASSAVARSRTLPMVAWVALTLFLTAIGAVIGRWTAPREERPVAEPVVFTLSPAPGARLAGGVRTFGISRDGRYVAFAALREGPQQLFVKALEQSEAVAVAGTENATYPVFSPDGASIAFIADGWVKRVPIAGGAPTTIAAVSAPRGLAWAPGDRIVFTPSAESGLRMVSASGGHPESLTELDLGKGETNHRWPVVLPDGSGVLFAVQRRSRTELHIEGVSFRSKARTVVREDGFPLQLLNTGHLVYAAVNGDMFAAPFDGSQMKLTGPAVPLPERPGYTQVSGTTAPAVSPGGTMVSEPFQAPERTLVVVTRDGRSRALPAPPRNYRQIRISPNGQRIAVVIQAGISEWDIWTMDAEGGSPPRRVTVSRFNVWPHWESDNTLTYSAFENATWRLLSRNIDRNEPPRELLSGLPQEPIVLGWLPDGSLAYTINLPQQVPYIVKDKGPPRAIPPPETGQFSRTLQMLSPNRRWLCYISNQSGQSEVYLTAFPEGGVTRVVSRGGGSSPVWAKAGQQLFYRRVQPGKADDIVSVTVNAGGSLGPPVVVLTGDFARAPVGFDVFPDGSLLIIRDLPVAASTLQVVVNWAALRGLTKTARR